MINISQQIAQELTVNPAQVQAAINLLDEGATVPFIARYRKEATQGLDDNHLRHLEQRLTYLRELQERKTLVVKNIQEQGKLTEQLRNAIEQADNKTSLEDLYLPYRPKRRTKGQIAIEAGIEPLADALLNDWNLDPQTEANKYLNRDANFPTSKEVLDGAAYILMERFSEDALLIQKLRRHLQKQAHINAKLVDENVQGAHKYKDYFQFSEKLSSIPSHRALAILRGRNEGVLQLSLNVDPHAELTESSAEQMIRDHYQLHVNQQAGATWLNRVVRLTWKVKLGLSLETELISTIREAAELEAIEVFARNLKALLMAAPGGPKVTMGIDPGIRTGCKIAIVDATGKLLHTTTIFPHEPQKHWQKSIRTLVHLINEHKIELVAIGNGTASRETDSLVAEALAEIDEAKPVKLIVSEAGASVYSASETASKEFPELDVSLRGAVSIARRLQDPLAELVKIEPKAIGVGQYQHDVSQSQLSKSLDAVVEDCVNAVGVDANSASIPLLSRVAGLSKTMAQNIVTYRDEHGAFKNRQQLLKVARLGPKAFEQAAGFIRINHGDNPLDASGVHPESYQLVNRMADESGMPVQKLIGEQQSIGQLKAANFVTEQFGLPTIQDILSELEKPGRDPRGEFKAAKFKEGVNKLTDLTENLILEGVVSNVTKFGAFVDIGVHQDGLVHISSLTNKFVSDPHEVVKAGDIVKVKVLDVDVKRKRISLTMRLDESANTAKPEQKRTQKASAKPEQGKRRDKNYDKNRNKQPANSMMGNAFADAFAKAKK